MWKHVQGLKIANPLDTNAFEEMCFGEVDGCRICIVPLFSFATYVSVSTMRERVQQVSQRGGSSYVGRGDMDFGCTSQQLSQILEVVCDICAKVHNNQVDTKAQWYDVI